MQDTRLLENYIVKIIAAITVLVIGYFAIQVCAGAYTNKLIKNFSGPAELQKEQFREQIANQTNAYEACRLGINFDKGQLDDLALLSFIKATDLDHEYRDAWLLRGQSELKNNQPEEALKSLKKAEELDPIHPRTYELLAIAYEATGDTQAAAKAKEKYEYLSNNR